MISRKFHVKLNEIEKSIESLWLCEPGYLVPCQQGEIKLIHEAQDPGADVQN